MVGIKSLQSKIVFCVFFEFLIYEMWGKNAKIIQNRLLVKKLRAAQYPFFLTGEKASASEGFGNNVRPQSSTHPPNVCIAVANIAGSA